MNQIIWLILRRMRPPLLLLIGVYSIATLGMVLVPGIVVDGQTTHMDFFHALYFVSYTSTTIGFGELPLAFSHAQRMWAMVSIYMSVVAWLYSIGAILTLVKDTAFRQALIERRFARSIRRIKEPFYLLCGYGEAGAALVQALTHYFIHLVVIDKNQDRINELSLQDQDLPVHIPGLCADAEIPEHLIEAGLKHPRCSRVIALTDSDAVNLKIAITSKLLNPDLKVIARASDLSIKANIASFGTEDIVDAFEIFGETIALALNAPDQYLLHTWLTGISDAVFERPPVPPRGKWIICGYGRFGHYLIEHLDEEGLPTVVIESNPDVNPPPQGMIQGRGTEAITLQEAGIKDAVGIIAGTDDDPNNLSIIMTARELNPQLFTVARQNLEANSVIFDALQADIVMNPGRVLADKIRDILTMPRLTEFLTLIRAQPNNYAREIYQQLTARIGPEIVPNIWVIKLTRGQAPALLDALSAKMNLNIRHLMTEPYQGENLLPAEPLLLIRGRERQLMPDADIALQSGDRVLFCGTGTAYTRMRLLSNDYYILSQLLTGREIPRSSVLRWVMGSGEESRLQ